MALRLLAISSPCDDLGTRRGAAAVSVANVERQARAREDGTDDHPKQQRKLGSLCGIQDGHSLPAAKPGQKG